MDLPGSDDNVSDDEIPVVEMEDSDEDAVCNQGRVKEEAIAGNISTNSTNGETKTKRFVCPACPVTFTKKVKIEHHWSIDHAEYSIW